MRFSFAASSPRGKQLAASVALGVMHVLFSPAASHAQGPSTVDGTVVAEGSQRPLAGVQIAVVGTPARGAVSDAAGRFHITGLTGTNVILTARLIGFRPATDTVLVGATNVRVTLAERALELDQLVVTGTAGGAQKRELGTTVASVNASEVLAQTPISTVESLLNGRTAGVDIIPASGQVGSAAAIRIRGVGTLSLSSTPLFYVDGIRVNNARFDDFDPEQIETIDVLKGAAAATLYGTEAARGVINIITKKGTTGAPRWSFAQKSGGQWFQDAAGRMPTNYWLNPKDSTIWSLNMVKSEAALGRSLFRTGRVNDNALNVSGGAGLYRYFVAADANWDSGIDQANAQAQKSFRTNLSVVPNSKIDIETSVGYVTSHTTTAGDGGSIGVFTGSEFSTPANTAAACAALYTPATTPRGCGWSRGALTAAGPPDMTHVYQQTSTDIQRFTGSISLKYDPFPWMSHRVLLGTDYAMSNRVVFTPYVTDSIYAFFLAANFDGSRSETSVPTTFNTYDYAGAVHFALRPDLQSKSTFGVQYYTNYSTSLVAAGTHYPSPGFSNISALGTKASPTSSLTQNNTLGAYGLQEFALNDRLFVTGAVRVDNNSAFGSKASFTTYPKISLSWVASEEPRMRNLLPSFVGDLRFRGAFGAAGQQPATNSALQTLTPVAGPNGATVLTHGNLGNATLKPERVVETEVGFEAGLWSDRLGVDFTYFNDISKDAILSVAAPPSSGFSASTFVNAGQINKSGVELTLKGKVIDARRLGWDMQVNVATAKSKIVRLTGADTLVGGNRVGYSPGDIFIMRVVSATYDPATRKAINPICLDAKGGTLPCYVPGTSTLQAPFVYDGHSIPTTTGSVTNSFRSGPLRLYVMTDFQTGHTKYDGTAEGRCQVFLTCDINLRPQNYDPAQVAQVQTSALRNMFYNSGDFLKLRDVSLSYDAPQALANKIRASSLAIMLSGHNLATATRYTGKDPEGNLAVQGSGNISVTDQTTYPQFTSFIVSIRLGY